MPREFTLKNRTEYPLVVLYAELTDRLESPPSALSQITFENGDKQLAAGADAAFELDCDGDKVYELLVSRLRAAYPVAYHEAAAAGPAVFVVDQEDTDATVAQTVRFIQTISAYPNARFTKDYLAVLKEAIAAGQAESDGGVIADKVNTFFKNTSGYKSVSFNSLQLVQRYYYHFPFIWGLYDKATYYLYSKNEQRQQSLFVGKVVIETPDSFDLSAANAGCKCNFYAAENPSDLGSTAVKTANVPLYYAEGMFVDDLQTDLPKIALQGSWMTRGSFTLEPADDSIITILSGNVTGSQSVGSTDEQLINPETSVWEIVGIVSAVVTVASLFAMCYSYYQWARNARHWYKKHHGADREEVNEENNRLEAGENQRVRQRGRALDLDEIELADLEEVVDRGAERIVVERENSVAQNQLERMEHSLEEMARFSEEFSREQRENLEGLAGEVGELRESVRRSARSSEGLSEEIKEGLQAATTELRKISGEVLEEISSTVAEHLEATNKVLEEIQEARVEQERVEEEIKENSETETDSVEIE